MTDEPESPEVEDEEEFDFNLPGYPDTLGVGQVFFYPDLGTFCEEHGAKAVQVAEDGGIWLFPSAGGKAIALDSIPAKTPGRLHSIKPADGKH